MNRALWKILKYGKITTIDSIIVTSSLPDFVMKETNLHNLEEDKFKQYWILLRNPSFEIHWYVSAHYQWYSISLLISFVPTKWIAIHLMYKSVMEPLSPRKTVISLWNLFLNTWIIMDLQTSWSINWRQTYPSSKQIM